MLEEDGRIDPDYDGIIPLCKKEMADKFRSYGNSWLELDDIYWKERIVNEADEYSKANTIEAEKRKLVNIINMAAMAFQTAKVNRGCRQHKVNKSDMISSYDIKTASNCMICGKDIWVFEGFITDGNIKK